MEPLVAIVGIAAISALEAFALKKGINGKMFAFSTMLIGLLAGLGLGDIPSLARLLTG